MPIADMTAGDIRDLLIAHAHQISHLNRETSLLGECHSGIQARGSFELFFQRWICFDFFKKGSKLIGRHCPESRETLSL